MLRAKRFVVRNVLKCAGCIGPARFLACPLASLGLSLPGNAAPDIGDSAPTFIAQTALGENSLPSRQPNHLRRDRSFSTSFPLHISSEFF
jgi:hypothetical protein